MVQSGRILLADDDECFLRSTARLLRKAGYECDCAQDAPTAVQMLCEKEYDVLIADVVMPGNTHLELIHQGPLIRRGLPVILITGYPSLDTAIQSVQLHIEAYHVKPINFDKLLEQVRAAIEKHRLLQDVCSAEQRFRQSCEELAHLKKLLEEGRVDSFPEAVEAFLAHTYQNIASSLLDACHVREATGLHPHAQYVCNLLECPTLSLLSDALRETIRVLDKTRRAFRSKELGDLRKRLEELVKKAESR